MKNARFLSALPLVGTALPLPVLANGLQEVEHGIAKYQWQMRAQIERTRTDPNTGWDLNDNKPIDLAPQAPAKP